MPIRKVSVKNLKGEKAISGKKVVYVVSDSVGETAELVVRAVASQFNSDPIDIYRFTNVKDQKDIDEVIQMARETESIIAYTLVVPQLKNYLDIQTAKENLLAVDLLNPLMDAFRKIFHKEPKHEPKSIRKLDDVYFKRIAAIEFTVKYDDGRDPRGALEADLVLIGVSRTSKTPLAMYLANRGYKVANIPLVPEVTPPDEIFLIPRNQCIGLTIQPEKLNEIRKERLKALGLNVNSNYASLERIFEELEFADRIMKRIGCPIIDVSNKAVEETASLILNLITKKERRKHHE